MFWAILISISEEMIFAYNTCILKEAYEKKNSFPFAVAKLKPMICRALVTTIVTYHACGNCDSQAVWDQRREHSSPESALLSEHSEVTKACGLDERMTWKQKHLEKKRRCLLAEKLQGSHSSEESIH